MGADAGGDGMSMNNPTARFDAARDAVFLVLPCWWMRHRTGPIDRRTVARIFALLAEAQRQPARCLCPVLLLAGVVWRTVGDASAAPCAMLRDALALKVRP